MANIVANLVNSNSTNVFVTPQSNQIDVNVSDSNNINLVVTPPTTQIVNIDRGVAGPGVATGGITGQVLAKASNANYDTTWVNNTEYATIINDTTTNAIRYPLFANATSGNITVEYTSSTKLKFNPSTGTLIVSNLIIAP